MPEPIAIDDIMTDINSQWNASNVTKPALITVNGANEPYRFDLNVGDHLIGRNGDPAMTETPIGNWKYGDRVFQVELELFTLTSRQRLYDLMREVRRICHARIHSLTNFQRQQFLSFTEETSDQANVWTGTIDIQLENNAVLLETT
jgi:hypothetical protein|tara:strand:+ start:594 stop:1031 length:438 start_codon:yes stop_codon:yes gene_type:complete